MLLDEFALNVGRHEFVGGKLGGERCASAGETRQRDAVVGQFLLRNLCHQFLITGLAVHTHDEGTTALQVAHHVAHIVGRHEHLQVVDRLQNLRTGILEGLGKCLTGSQHERQFVGIHGVHLSVIDDDADVAGIRTGERSLLHTGHHTLEDGGHETGIDGTTHHGVEEHQFSTPFEVNFLSRLDVHAELLSAELIHRGIGHTLGIGLHNEVHLTELAGTARLLLVTIVGTGSLGDSLTIWNLRFLVVNLDFLVVLHAPFQCAQVELTLSVDDNLAEFLRLLHHPRRVFLAHLGQCSHHLLRLTLVHGLHGTRIFRVGIFDEVVTVLTVLAVERVTGLHVLQFHGTADVTGIELIHGLTVCSGTGVELRQTLLRTAVGIGEVVAGLHRTAHHLEVGHLTDMRLHTRLEEIQ